MQRNGKENLILTAHIAVAVPDPARGQDLKVTEQSDSEAPVSGICLHGLQQTLSNS